VSRNPISLAPGATGKIGPNVPTSRGVKRLRSRSPFPNFSRYIYRRSQRILKSLISRIDVLNFPGSCCG
jgi:hypothetical protein